MQSPHLPCGSRMLLTPPSLTLIFKQRLDRVCGVVLCTFFICTHCVAIPSTVSPTRLTSAVEQKCTCHSPQREAAVFCPHLDCTRHLQPVCGRCWQVEGQSSWWNPAVALPGTCACLTPDRMGSWGRITHHPCVTRAQGRVSRTSYDCSFSRPSAGMSPHVKQMPGELKMKVPASSKPSVNTEPTSKAVGSLLPHSQIPS